MRFNIMCISRQEADKHNFTVGKIYDYDSERTPCLVSDNGYPFFQIYKNPNVTEWDFLGGDSKEKTKFVRVPKKGDKVIFRKDRERKYSCVPKDGEICTVSRDGVKWNNNADEFIIWIDFNGVCNDWPICSDSVDYCDCLESGVNYSSREEEQTIPDMSSDDILKMLAPKFIKNGWAVSIPEDCYSVRANNVKDIVALAYRSGYECGLKGRPFKIGEKKKKSGHWVPVDPNNLPKEGTKVRYSRECKAYKNHKDKIVIRDTGVVNFEGPEHKWFGIKLDNRRNLYYNWLSFEGQFANCLDMWMEDDE